MSDRGLEPGPPTLGSACQSSPLYGEGGELGVLILNYAFLFSVALYTVFVWFPILMSVPSWQINRDKGGQSLAVCGV